MTAGERAGNAGWGTFLSHSSADADLARRIAEAVEARGIRCWLAPRDVTPGKPYAEECVKGIELSQTFVLLASSTSVASVQVLSEVEQAHQRNKPIFTVMLGKPKVSRELSFYISRLHWIEYGDESLARLTDALTTVLSGERAWDDVASPPSLRRSLVYRRDALLGSAIASLLVIGLAGAGLFVKDSRERRRTARDASSLGFVVLTAQPAESEARTVVQLEAQVPLRFERPNRQVSLSSHSVPRPQIPICLG